MPAYEPPPKRPFYLKHISKRFSKSSPDVQVSVLAPNLPPELWLQVVSLLDTRDATSVTLTCRTLCDIAQSSLFENVVFNPFIDPDILSLERPGVFNLRSESSYRRKALKRLAFFSTPRIRHAVKHVCIGPSGKFPRRSSLLDDLVDAIVLALPQFCNLSSLVCKQLDLTPQRITVLQSLTLRSVVFESCVSKDASGLPLHLMALEKVSFSLAQETNPTESGLQQADFLSPAHLTYLSSASPFNALENLCASAPFNQLRDLELPATSTASPLFLTALARCANLHRLVLNTETEVGLPALSTIPADLIPALAHYRGPRCYVTKIAASRPVRILDITPMCKPERLITTLHKLDGKSITHHLETLTIRCSQTPPPFFLLQIHQTFASLRYLTMKGVYIDVPQWVNMFKTATPQPHLRHLRICLNLGDADHASSFWKMPEQEEKSMVGVFDKLHPFLLQVYPRLKKVQAVSGTSGVLAVWRRQSVPMKEGGQKPTAVLQVGDTTVDIGFPGLRKARSF